MTEEEKQVGEESVTKVKEQLEQGGEVVRTHSKQTSVARKPPEEELKVGVDEGHSPRKQKRSTGEKHGQQLDPDYNLPKNER